MRWRRLLGCRRRRARSQERDPSFDEAQERLRLVNDRAARVAYRLGRDDWPEMVSEIYRGERR